MTPRSFDESRLDWIEQLRTRWGVSGISVALVLGPDYFGEDKWLEKCFCYGNADSVGTPVTPDTLWPVGACGHAITMLSIATLIDRKVHTLKGEPITYYSKMKDLLVDWKLQDEYASEHLDLVDVMEHRTGLPRHHFSSQSDESTAELVKRLRHLRPSCEPRYDFQYSDIHYDILQEVVTTLTGMPFAEYVKQQFFDPLGFQQSTCDLATAQRMGLVAEGYARAEYNQQELLRICKEERRVDTWSLGTAVPLETITRTDGSAEGSSTGLMMSGTDMVKWGKAFMNSPLIASLWSRTTLKASYNYPMTFRSSNLHYPELGGWSYGLGMGISTYRGHYTGGDQGRVRGGAARFARLPNEAAHIFVAVNDGTHGEMIADWVTYYLYDVLLGMEPVDWEAKYLDRMVSTLPAVVALPDHPRPPVGREEIEGEYADPGYGSFTLLSSGTHSNDRRLMDALRKHIQQTSQADLCWLSPIYIAPFPSMWSTHLIFLHHDGNIWDCLVSQLLHKPEELVVASASRCKAILNGNGIGFFEGFWGAGKARYDRPVSEQDVEKRAEVWFAKQNPTHAST